MKRIQVIILFVSFPLIAFGLAFFAIIRAGASSYTFADHSLKLPFPLFPLVFLGFLALLILSWLGIARIERRFFLADSGSLLWENFFAYLPFAFSLLSPLLLSFYLTSDDLKVRLGLLSVFMSMGFLLIKLIQWYRRGRLKDFFERNLSRFNGLSLRKRLIILFLIACVVYHLCVFSYVSKGFAYSGDEPYYLMTTHSLYQDGDINLARNYTDFDYFHFYPKELYPNLRLRAYARFGKKGTDYVWSINQPGVSALMLPYYWLSQKFQGRTLIFIIKISLAIWAALLGLQVYLFAREFWKNEKVSLWLWLLYSFSAPVLFYSFHLYPEIPIALFSLFIFRKIISKKKISLTSIFFLGFLLALFPWFGLKYNMVMWPLFLVSIFFLLKNHKVRWKVTAFLAFPIVSVVLFAFYTKELYGTFYPMAIYEGVLTAERVQAFREMVMNIPVMLRIDSFFDYFLDQRDGLLLYSPVYFFLFIGAVEAFRRSKKVLFSLLFISLPYLFNYAFFSHRQGHSPQGRVLANISWVAVILIGYFLVHNRKRLYFILFLSFAFLGIIFVFLLLQNPAFLYQPTTHQFTFRGGELFIHLSNLHFYLPAYLPSFIKIDNLGYMPNYIWICGILLFVVGYAWKRNGAMDKPVLTHRPFLPALFTVCAVGIFFLWLVLYPRATLLFPTHAAYASGERISFYDLGRHVQMKQEEPGRFTITKDNHALDLYFTSWRKLENLEIECGNLKGKYHVELKFFDREIFSGIIDREMKKFLLSSPPLYPYKNTNLYRLRIEIKSLTDISTAQNPFLLILRPVR